MAQGRAATKGEDHEGQKFAPLAQAASPRLPRRAPQGPRLCYQQDAAPVQSPSGLSQAQELMI